MSEYDNICYNKNYVDEVICRLDFASPIDVFKNSMPKSIYDVVKKYYPIAEPQDIIGTELQISPGNAQVNNIVTKKWLFLSVDRKNKCSIDSESVIFSISSYNVFESLEKAIVDIISKIMEQYPDIQGKRLGLRYINKLPLDGNEEWINAKFYDAISEHKDVNITRMVTNCEYAILDKDINVHLQYGYFNPDYPAILKQNEFTIDIDSYSAGIIYYEDVSALLKNMHYEDQKWFETMITDDLRDIMNKQG